MFEQSVIPKGKTRKPWTVACAIVAQLLVVGIMIVIPLMFVEAMPAPELFSRLVAPPPPPPPPPPPAPARVAKVVFRRFNPNTLIAPRTIPKQIAMVKDIPTPPTAGVIGGVQGGVPGGQLGGVIGGILGSMPGPPAPAPPRALPKPAPPKPAAPKLVHVGGNIEAARLIEGTPPAYPVLAREARVQGTVLMDAIIGKDGKIEKLSVVSGNPLLVTAAMNAVEHWVYQPTLLNGQPTAVSTEITVHFRLS